MKQIIIMGWYYGCIVIGEKEMKMRSYTISPINYLCLKMLNPFFYVYFFLSLVVHIFFFTCISYFLYAPLLCGIGNSAARFVCDHSNINQIFWSNMSKYLPTRKRMHSRSEVNGVGLVGRHMNHNECQAEKNPCVRFCDCLQNVGWTTTMTMTIIRWVSIQPKAQTGAPNWMDYTSARERATQKVSNIQKCTVHPFQPGYYYKSMWSHADGVEQKKINFRIGAEKWLTATSITLSFNRSSGVIGCILSAAFVCHVILT